MPLWGNGKLHQRVVALTPRLHVIARSWGCSPDLCDDLVQETLATALNKISQLRKEAALEVWVIRILTNSHRLYLRQHKYLSPLDSHELIDELDPQHSLDAQQTIDMVRAAIGLLSDEQRKVLTLVDMESFSYQKVAEILDIKIGTVMSRLSRARAQLRKIINDISARTNRTETQPDLWRVK